MPRRHPLSRSIPRLALLLLALGACTGSPTEPGTPPPALTALPRSLTSAEQSVIAASNRFSFALFGRVSSAQRDSNVFVSPLSASMSLGMATNGAAGQTYDEMRTTLQFGNASQGDIDAGYKSLIALLGSLDPAVKMQVANSVWFDKSFPVKAGFLDTVRTFFDAEAQPLDFSNAAAAVSTINGWVKTKTNGTIPSLIDGIDSGEILYLVNAIYFKGKWRDRFDPQTTAPGDFHAAGGSVQRVPVMHREGTIAYAAGPGWQAVDLPYGDSAFSMTVVLPADDVETFVDSLTPAFWSSLTAAFVPRQVDLKLPRLTLDYSRLLTDDLESLGMRAAFDPNSADFSRMSPLALYVTRVQQKAFVAVDEDGTEASAATVTGFAPTSVETITPVVIDRPYLFVIRERLSGTVLFMGKVTRIPGA